MCGIVGFNWNDEKLAKKMADLIQHRGPDDEGFYSDEHISLGNRRLAIIDLKTGKQPIYSKDNNLVITYNGEVYNFPELKTKLERKGHIFYTHTDTEVILHLYQQYGKQCVKMLNGMFTFAIWDYKKKELFIARDRMGVKPLYYYWKNGKFIFASEIKAILAHSFIHRIPNPEALSEYLTFENILDNKTFFQDIKILLPGHYLRLKDKKLIHGKYWDVTFKYKKRSHEQTLNEFRRILRESVKRHMISDVPLGCYLSGGFDSATVTTTASELVKDHVETFTGAFDISGKYDERTGSRAVAKKTHASMHEVVIQKEDFEKNMEKIVYHLDEPRVGIPTFSQYHVSKLVSEHVKVVLTGHGGDELFAGYAVFKALHHREQLKKSKKHLVKLFKDLLVGKNRLNMLYYLLMPYLNSEVQYGLIIVFSEKEKKNLLTHEFLKKTKFSSDQAIAAVLKGKKFTDSERLQYLYLKTYLPSLFVVEDKVGMAHSIEARVPLCDNEMVEFALSIPLEQKLHHGQLKSIIKEAMRGKLPDVLYHQEKKGFPTPLGPWLEKDLKQYFKKVLLSKKCLQRKIFNEDYIRKLVEKSDFLSCNKLWCLLNVELWFRVFIDKETRWV
ncbi:MAG TPA: asparagine synthase (glutamine-hydrolyzing) [Candidatus Nanoarchaeia archaeon]|nr:asparagine synthase (glutamine-hydrolyzing) [Candidatus Nanoarchaeia archaeon]